MNGGVTIYNNEAFKKFEEINYKGFADFLASLSGAEYLLITGILALVITHNISTTAQNSIGNFFMQLGQSIITVTGQNIGDHPHGATEENMKKLKDEIEEIKRRLGY